MRSLLFTLILSGLIFTAHAQTTFRIEGKIKLDSPIVKAVIGYENGPGGKYVMDTVNVNNGKFAFTGTTSRPSSAIIFLLTRNRLKAKRKKSDDDDGVDRALSCMLYGEGDMTIDWGKDAVNISGPGEEEKVFAEYMREMIVFNKDKNDSSLDAMRSKIGEFVKAHPDSYASFDLFKGWFASVIIPDQFEPIYNALSPRLKALPEAATWAADLDEAKRLSPGMAAPVFTENSVTGVPVSLSSFKGKYVLVDFWASWCGPCRATNPALIKLFKAFSAKNFTILGVSLDTEKAPWVKAIKEDGVTWTQVSDLKGDNNEARKMYKVSTIPQNYLVDPDGKIVAKNLSPEELAKKLEEVLK